MFGISLQLSRDTKLLSSDRCHVSNLAVFCAGKFFYFVLTIFLTLNLMTWASSSQTPLSALMSMTWRKPGLAGQRSMCMHMHIIALCFAFQPYRIWPGYRLR